MEPLKFITKTMLLNIYALWHKSDLNVMLYRDLWRLSKSAFQEKKLDVHTKLMRMYKQVPEWWFTCILLVNIAATIFICEYYNDQLQLPWWAVLLACGLAFFFTLPIGVITATTNQVSLPLPFDRLSNCVTFVCLLVFS